jgi:hypothetical protein
MTTSESFRFAWVIDALLIFNYTANDDATATGANNIAPKPVMVCVSRVICVRPQISAKVQCQVNKSLYQSLGLVPSFPPDR